jgi:putative DNA primase/helicase
MNIQEIKKNYHIEEVIDQHISGGLKRQGTQWVGNCPFHNDTHASLKVSATKNNWKCFVVSCGKGGDMFDFFTEQGKTLQEAANIITGGSIMPAAAPRIPKPENKWINAIPDQNSLPNPLELSHHRYSEKPVAFWAYHDLNANVIGFTCRFNLPEGKKDVMPYSFKQQISPDGLPLGNAVWRWSELDKPRPLYNLHELTQRSETIVLLVEGEKTADAAKRLFPQYVATTWIGGSDNVKHTDWTPLHGRRVFLWNDNDLPGILCMFGGWSHNSVSNQYTRITGIAEMFSANFKRIQNSKDFPKKWDVADADWTQEQAIEYLQNNKTDIPVISDYPPNEIPLMPAIETPVLPPPPPNPVEFIEEIPTNSYFRPLGLENNGDQNIYVFYVYRTNVIVKLTASSISNANLLQLAPLNYWEGAYPKQSRSGSTKFEITTVADDLVSMCSDVGFFNPDKIRGRGAWIDNGVPILHCGDHLIVNGVETKLSKFKSKFIYPAGQELGFSLIEPLKKTQANQLIQILERLNWSRDIDARLLAGWIVIAPLCGALNWRSHLWVTGASGSGKSEVMKLFIKKLLGSMFVDVQGSTTEAGIRQYLKADALAVVFDEAESEGKNGADRMQSILEIVRAASTSDSGKIFKGSAGGNASQFNIRSCFAFASIGANLSQKSDISRISVLELQKDKSPDKQQKWKETLKMHSEIITDDFVQKFQSRSIMMLPTILKNASVFSNAVGSELDNQRTGDQLGIILAGAYSLTSDSLISMEAATAWIKEKDWTEERLHESTRDEIKIINKIIDSETTVEATYGKITRTIGEIVIIARGDVVTQSESNFISEDLANITLRRLGIKLEGFNIIFSDNSEYISKVLSDTPYRKNYNTILCRMDSAIKMEPTTFASGIKSRAVKISTLEIFGDYENPGIEKII